MCLFLHITITTGGINVHAVQLQGGKGNMILLASICRKKTLPQRKGNTSEAYAHSELLGHILFSFCGMTSWIYVVCISIHRVLLCVIIFLLYLSMCNLSWMRPKDCIT